LEERKYMLPKAMRGWLEGCYIKADGSNVVDLSHDWHEGMTQPAFFPPMIHEGFDTIEKDGVLSFYNHLLESCGTHCEAPAHVISGAPTIEKIPLSWLIGPAAVINIRDKCEMNPDYKLSVSDLNNWEMQYDRIPDHSWLIMSSGWTDRWDTPAFFNTDNDLKDHYPGFDPAAMRWLVKNNRHIIGIATECMSPEGGSAARALEPSVKMNTTAKTWEREKLQDTSPVENKTHPGRRPAIPARNELLPIWNTLVISNMANVYKLPEASAWIIVGVIPFRGGSAGQARVFGVLPVKRDPF
jgi:kynurenine formamidase